MSPPDRSSKTSPCADMTATNATAFIYLHQLKLPPWWPKSQNFGPALRAGPSPFPSRFHTPSPPSLTLIFPLSLFILPLRLFSTPPPSPNSHPSLTCCLTPSVLPSSFVHFIPFDPPRTFTARLDLSFNFTIAYPVSRLSTQIIKIQRYLFLFWNWQGRCRFHLDENTENHQKIC